MSMTPCSAYIVAGGICRNGFPQHHGVCTGNVACHCCGRHGDSVPACQREDLGKAWLDDAGLPRLAKSQQAGEVKP